MNGKKRWTAATAGLLCAVLLLSACAPAAAPPAARPPATETAPEGTEGSAAPATQVSGEDTVFTDPLPPETGTEDPPPEEPLFTYDPYLVRADAKRWLTEREAALYRDMVTAVLDHSGTVSGFASYEEFFKVWGVLLAEFIPARNMVSTYRDSEEPYVYEDGTATLRFVGDKETCDANHEALRRVIDRGLALLREDDDEWERIAKLYLFVSKNMRYGNPYTEYGVYGDMYSSIVYGLGMCAEYAVFLNLLADHAGFETIQARSLGRDGNETADHSWSLIRVGGTWYHFDACFQATDPSAWPLRWFAITSEERYQTLLANNPFGIPVGDVDMYWQDYYTSGGSRLELPPCGEDPGDGFRRRLYDAVIGEYLDAAEHELTDRELEIRIAELSKAVREAVWAGADGVGVSLRFKEWATNSLVLDFLRTYSSDDLDNYPDIPPDAGPFGPAEMVLKYLDLSSPEEMFYFILHEPIVIQDSVRIVR